MGATYTAAQKAATQKYINSTDQIRVRTGKGNLDFIKNHAKDMGYLEIYFYQVIIIMKLIFLLTIIGT